MMKTIIERKVDIFMFNITLFPFQLSYMQLYVVAYIHKQIK